MERTAQCLSRKARLRKPLPALLAFTDPQRTPELDALAEGLPAGAALVYRTFGARSAPDVASRLRKVASRRALRLLIGADAGLAGRVRADGVHLPQRLAHRAHRLKAAHPGWIVTAAAHDLASARRAARAGVDAVVLSTVFASASPSAGRPMGPLRLARLVQEIPAPVYALGGVDNKNARRLLASGVVGLAGVGVFRT